ncbi:MAG: type VI secretion system tip protein VgrG, partial [Planctomycetales bacterium]|nr:type VI secretion system tip protein VgrG [Planctomycetales bacterium]
MIRSQKYRNASVRTVLPADKVLLYRMTGAEKLSEQFCFDVEVLSEDFNVDLDKVLGNPATVSVEMDSLGKRHFNGVVGSAAQIGTVGELALYKLTLRPWTWLLSHTSDCRVFQKMSVPEIVQKVCKDKHFTDFKLSLSRKYEKREYCVQYCESDLNFIDRLLESEGIYYYFDHEESKHTLILADAPNSHENIKQDPKIPYCAGNTNAKNFNYIHQWSVSHQVRPGQVVLGDFDFEKPKTELKSVSKEKRDYTNSKFEYFDFPGGFTESKSGDIRARDRLDEFQSDFDTATGSGCVLMLSSGRRFQLQEHPRKDQNREYLITSASFSVHGDSYQAGGGSTGEPYSCSFSVMPSNQTYRPSRNTRTPRIYGVQTAIVVGKKNEEIWTDKHGRIKVQFHWDRYGKKDQDSSCWVRVAQTWAGKGWGTQQIPRIGQEVLVEFIDGDPDRPLITGSVYNGDHAPPFTLPANATQSGIRSRSSAKGNAKTFNELRFEDKEGSEEIYFHAEKNFTRVVENNDSLKVGFDDKSDGNQVVDIYNDKTVTLENGNRKATIKKGNDS